MRTMMEQMNTTMARYRKIVLSLDLEDPLTCLTPLTSAPCSICAYVHVCVCALAHARVLVCVHVRVCRPEVQIA